MVTLEKFGSMFQVVLVMNNKRVVRSFKNIEEALEYRDMLLN